MLGDGELGMGHWALVLSEVVGAASRREVLGIGPWAFWTRKERFLGFAVKDTS